MEIKIDTIIGREIIDSRGNPTVEGLLPKHQFRQVLQQANLKPLNSVTATSVITEKVFREQLKISTA